MEKAPFIKGIAIIGSTKRTSLEDSSTDNKTKKFNSHVPRVICHIIALFMILPHFLASKECHWDKSIQTFCFKGRPGFSRYTQTHQSYKKLL